MVPRPLEMAPAVEWRLTYLSGGLTIGVNKTGSNGKGKNQLTGRTQGPRHG